MRFVHGSFEHFVELGSTTVSELLAYNGISEETSRKTVFYHNFPPLPFNVTDEPQNSCSGVTSGSPKAAACLGEVRTA